MKFRISLLFLAILAISVAGLSQPKIAIVSGSTIDMGSVYSGEMAETVALIQNTGTDTLRIENVKAQCGCTATLLSEKILAPNDTGKLSISFNTAGRNGHNSKQVYISSNDPENPKLTITFSADVKNVLDIIPKVVTFDNSKIDSVYTKTVKITNPSETESINILDVLADIPLIKTELMKRKLMPGEETQLQVTISPEKAGTVNGTISLMTDHKRQSKFTIGVFAFVSRK